MPDLVVLPNAAAVHDEAARRIVAACFRAQRERGVFTWALAGGSTPRATYERLRTAPIDWSRTHVLWSDERAVPGDSQQSNARMAREALLDHVPIPTHHVHPMDGAAPDLEAAARAYEAEMLELLGEPPRLDLALLGLGEDAHTASLFPGAPALDETERLVVHVPVAPIVARLTWTPAALRAAERVLVLVSGDGKRAALKRALDEPYDPHNVPIQAVTAQHAHATFLADPAAAGPAHPPASLDARRRGPVP